jgi:hypothetical protein
MPTWVIILAASVEAVLLAFLFWFLLEVIRVLRLAVRALRKYLGDR